MKMNLHPKTRFEGPQKSPKPNWNLDNIFWIKFILATLLQSNLLLLLN